ncbi:MAG: D-alanyl-D-alanine carboxypeptidase family protein [Gaiellaceae bacterium]
MRRWIVVTAALALAPSALAGLPHVNARAFLVQNAATGEVVAHYHQRQRVPIASLTKLMTVLLTLEHARLNDVVTVAPQAAAVGQSSIGLRAGQRLTVRELLEGALIQSANDAADALAYHVAHGDVSRFVAMMNARARRLGLTDTHYVRPDGLDAAGAYSSARDVTRLAWILMRKPVVRAIVRRPTATISGGRVLHTWNDLLGTFPGVFGVKTGHTAAAGWNEVAAARRHGATVYATILGSPDRVTRNRELARLLSLGLSRFRPIVAVRARYPYAYAETGYGRGRLALVAARSFVPVIRVGRPVLVQVAAPGVVSLPVRGGQRLGEIRVYQRGRLLGRRPLVAARTVSRPGVFGRVGWYAGRTAHHVWDWVR